MQGLIKPRSNKLFSKIKVEKNFDSLVFFSIKNNIEIPSEKPRRFKKRNTIKEVQKPFMLKKHLRIIDSGENLGFIKI